MSNVFDAADYEDSFESIILNDWRCSGTFRDEFCGALLGRTDSTHTVLHQKRSTHHESWVYDLGGVAVARRCRKCGKVNWLFSADVDELTRIQLIAEFEDA